MNLKHVPPSAPTTMFDKNEGKQGEKDKMKKVTINNNNDNHNDNVRKKSERRMDQ
jgi:hypothetical protein